MLRYATSLLVVGVQLAVSVGLEAPWPYSNLLSYAEELLYESPGRLSITVGCSERDNSTIAAQWIRLAYHDMATHDVEDGTGGLDASIRFELNRTENVGIGMAQSLTDLGFQQTPFMSFADVIALGVVFASPSCGGPFVPYRAGRVDASGAGLPGVPEPQQDLESHIASFKRQGFNISEMIALVACGHGVGGVRSEDFPEAKLKHEFALFHGEQHFDNTVVTGWLDGTTENPLVTAPNETFRSDLRIFGSDGNATMQSLASGQAFNRTCSSLFERMINTVPRGVELTDIIEPIEHKISATRLFPSQNSDYLQLKTTLRLINPQDNPKRTVTLFWADRQGSFCPPEGCSVTSLGSQIRTGADGPGGSGFDLRGMTAMRYLFNATINSTTSISKFWFEIDEHDGSEKVAINNGGIGFGIDQDTVLFDPIRTTRVVGSAPFTKVSVGVKKGTNPSRVHVETFSVTDDLAPEFIPRYATRDLEVDTEAPPHDGYTFYTTNIDTSVILFDLHADVGSQTITQEWIRPSLEIFDF